MKNLSDISGMPQLKAVFTNWQKKITLTRRIQTITAGLVSTADTQFTFQGIIQPLSPRQIALKPDGQRAWTWLQIHVVSSSENLNVNDQIIYNSVIYKIMARLDYSLNGYIEYHAVEEYQ